MGWNYFAEERRMFARPSCWELLGRVFMGGTSPIECTTLIKGRGGTLLGFTESYD